MANEENEIEAGVFNIELLNLKRGLNTLTHLDEDTRKFLINPQSKHAARMLGHIELLLIQLGPKFRDDYHILTDDLTTLRETFNNGWETNNTFNKDIIKLVHDINKSAYNNGILSAGSPTQEEWQQEQLPGITIIEGNLGAGKTLSAVLIAEIYKEKYKRNIYANFHLNMEYTPIRNYNNLQNTREGLLILDESYDLHDSRRGATKKNLVVNTIIQNSRKKNFHVIEIAQRADMIDKRIRELTNRVITPKIIGHYNGKPNKMLWKINAPVKKHILKAPKWEETQILRVEIPEETLELYDTNSPIYNFTLREEEAKSKKEPTLEEKATEYWKKHPNATHYEVVKALGVGHATSQRGKKRAEDSSSSTGGS